MSLKDFRPEPPDFDDEEPLAEDTGGDIEPSSYHEEINTLKIDKLSNRVTIISIIIPCLIGALLVFGYLDIKERVVDVDLTKQSQYEKISRQLEEKLNALDVRIAKNRYDLDNTLPGLEKKSIALEGRLTQKADAKALKSQIAKLERRVKEDAKKSKTLNANTQKALKATQEKMDGTGKQIKDEIALFKEEFDARLLELSDYEQQIGELRKNFSLLDKKQRTLTQESFSMTQANEQAAQIKNEIAVFAEKLKTLDRKLNTNITRLQNDLDTLLKTGGTGSAGDKPSPRIQIDSSGSEPIKAEPLTQ